MHVEQGGGAPRLSRHAPPRTCETVGDDEIRGGPVGAPAEGGECLAGGSDVTRGQQRPGIDDRHRGAERGEFGAQRPVLRADHLHLRTGCSQCPPEVEQEARRTLQAQAVRGSNTRRGTAGLACAGVSISGAAGWAGRCRAAASSSARRVAT